MNFKVTIQQPGQPSKVFQFQSGTVSVQPLATDDILRVKCLVRPDDWLQVRSNVVSSNGLELTHATIIESDPVRDPNHWLKRTDSQIGKHTKLVADSISVRVRRHFVRKGAKHD